MQRYITPAFIQQLHLNKILQISGPPKIGKVDFATKILTQQNFPHEVIDFKNKEIRKKFNELSDDEFIWYFKQFPYFVIGNAQLFNRLQFLIDYILNETVQTTLILCNAYKAPMHEDLKTALEWQGLDFYLPAPSFYELSQLNGFTKEDKKIEQRLIYGNYAQVDDSPENANEILMEMVNACLETQIGVDDRINKRDALLKTLQVAAHLIGEPISFNQIAERVRIDNETVERYLKLLEAAHLLFLLPSFHTEKRYELKKTHIVYFSDNGLRNALINNFNPLDVRMDEDALWRNWLVAERIKWNKMNGKVAKYSFWRSHTRQQIDFIEMQESKTFAYRFALDKKKKIKNAPLFTSYYPDFIFKPVQRNSFLTFLTQK
jgi:uncharacterized protein